MQYQPKPNPKPTPPPPRLNASARMTRSLPYFQLADVFLRIGNDAIDFYHRITHSQTGLTAKVIGSHTFTSQERDTLNAGGTVVVTDKSGNSFHIKL
ncbi:hypothetical protein [Zavarzinella formosa]|uniref:hypothetical protein n=1 Tax=Zavarzinella formosa TaxID=360055 RepID=UPI0003625569|nr:hypothetical protein [Zavarzinella formosa]